ncbi:MAG: hypothetical protein H6834_08750 [Planctomycetes bacterium]|nr:hypothetical protein [Planctomycetota bacterium]
MRADYASVNVALDTRSHLWKVSWSRLDSSLAPRCSGTTSTRGERFVIKTHAAHRGEGQQT